MSGNGCSNLTADFNKVSSHSNDNLLRTHHKHSERANLSSIAYTELFKTDELSNRHRPMFKGFIGNI